MSEKPLLSGRARRALAALMGAGAVGFAAGVIFGPERAWPGLLVNAFFFLSLALGAALFVSIHHVSNAAWSAAVRRVPEAMMSYLPFGALGLLALFFGRHAVYEWVGTSYLHDNHELVFKNAWLSTPFFFARMALILGAWVLLAALLRRESRRQDADADWEHTRRSKKYAAVFLVVFAVTMTFASFDWLMSVEPLFYSTIYAFYVIAGVLLGGLGAITLLTVLLRRRGLLPRVNENHLHNLGRLLFGFATFWAYIWLCQFILIYYANLPEETVYYYRRTETPGWKAFFVSNILLNWVVPFLALLPRGAKRSEGWLLFAAGAVLLGHWVDLYVLIFPGLGLSPLCGPAEVALALGLAALFLRTSLGSLGKLPLLPEHDPYMEEGLWQEPRGALEAEAAWGARTRGGAPVI